jgi:L-serine dehydratase
MHSLTQLYRIGNGPSSSHTLAPRRAAERFAADHPEARSFRVTLYGSLGATGKGHLTDKALCEGLSPRPIEILWKGEEVLGPHPNGMRFEALGRSGEVLATRDEFSTGGGALLSDNSGVSFYSHSLLQEVLEHCESAGTRFWEYVLEHEDDGFQEFLGRIWSAMRSSIARGLLESGILPGGLDIPRKAGALRARALQHEGAILSEGLLASYAYAVAEENAAGGVVVTAPTCGSCGVLPAVLHHLVRRHNFANVELSRALATAGLFGNVVKHNSSLSGAVVGCQGEIGTACAMAAAAATQLLGGSLRQIEYAAEMGLEHHFGLTCDPVAGLVQIPCIERNAHAATRAMSCCRFALLSDGSHRISFDDAVAVMDETGRALPRLFRETSMGGLAQVYARRLR